jgi:hypothetical protein
MPKKLGLIAKMIAALQDKHYDLLDDLRKYSQGFNTHKEVIEEGEAELAKQIKQIRPKGKAGDVVNDYSKDKVAGTMITELENQRALLIKAADNVFSTKQELKTNIDTTPTVVQSAQDVADDKKRNWIVTSTVQKIEGLITGLQSWYDTEDKEIKKLGVKKVKTDWAKPGLLKKMTVDSLISVDHKYQTDDETIKWLAIRAQVDKSRKNTLKKIHDDMVELAKQNKDT